MALRRQDIAVVLCYLLGLGRTLARKRASRGLRTLRILAWHDVLPGQEASFGRKLAYLRAQFKVVPLNHLEMGKESSGSESVALTFDDGYKSWMNAVAPMLSSYGMSATFFVCSGFVGLEGAKLKAFLRERLFRTIGERRISGALDWQDLRSLIGSGFEIGSHTRNHSHVPELSSEDAIAEEVGGDKVSLENATGRPITTFAYPCGFHRHKRFDIPALLKDMGFTAAVTAESGFNTIESNKYLLCRDIVGPEMPDLVFRARVEGNYEIVRRIRARLRK